MGTLTFTSTELNTYFAKEMADLTRDMEKKLKRTALPGELKFSFEYGQRIKGYVGMSGLQEMFDRKDDEPVFDPESYIFTNLTVRCGRKVSHLDKTLNNSQKNFVMGKFKDEFDKWQMERKSISDHASSLTDEEYENGLRALFPQGFLIGRVGKTKG